MSGLGVKYQDRLHALNAGHLIGIRIGTIARPTKQGIDYFPVDGQSKEGTL